MFSATNAQRLGILCGSALVTLITTTPAHAFLQNLVRTTTESKSVAATYDLPGISDAKAVQDIVHKALTYHGDNAHVKSGVPGLAVPQYPKKITFKPFNIGPFSMQLPICEDAAFTVSSTDGSMAQWGDSANYMACGFAYQGGFRVSIYAQSQSTNGGAAGLLSGKTIGKLITSAIGLQSDPMKFVEASLTKMEQLMSEAQINYTLVDMSPLMGQRVVSADPLVEKQRSVEKRAGDRAKRLAARGELGKLGVDAADRERFMRAVQSGDEDLVALFLEAGAIDPNQPDASGRRAIDLAQKPAVRELLQSM
jgi:hypothetical protein